MPIGTAVRGMLGGLEPTAIRIWRGCFIDVDALADTLASVVPQTKRILEIGCGDGAVASALRRKWPECHILGIDPGAITLGAMFEGDREGVEFRPILSSDLIAEQPELFDLVSMCDVLHHAADSDRQQLLLDAATLTAPGGTVAIKEWERVRGLSYYAAYGADRWISGDATVRFMPRSELQGMIENAMPGWTTTCEARIPPRRANLLVTLQRPALS